jgi:type IV secretion system protein TrbL
MVLAIIVGVGSTLFGTIVTEPSGDITLEQAAAEILGAISVFGLAIFAPGIAAGLVSGAPQLGAGAAVGTAAGLAATGIAGASLAGAGARAALGASSRAVTAAASLTGTTRAAYESGGMGGVFQATIAKPASTAAARLTAPVRDAYREGTAAGYRATGTRAPGGSGSASARHSSVSAEPDWARRIRRHERLKGASATAGSAIKEGDRGAASEGPDLSSND